MNSDLFFVFLCFSIILTKDASDFGSFAEMFSTLAVVSMFLYFLGSSFYCCQSVFLCFFKLTPYIWQISYLMASKSGGSMLVWLFVTNPECKTNSDIVTVLFIAFALLHLYYRKLLNDDSSGSCVDCLAAYQLLHWLINAEVYFIRNFIFGES